MSKSSLITTAKNRKQNLLNLLAGVEKGNLKPDEVVIVSMDEVLDLPKNYSFPVRVVRLEVENNNMLPIAKARNLGANSAKFDVLHFLDVDCIPSTNYLEIMSRKLQNHEGLLMGNPKYMTKKIAGNFDEKFLTENSILHPGRPVMHSEIEKSPAYSLFWSLCFSIRRKTFEEIGGFSEEYLGYGAEDTDFAFKAEKQQIDFHLVKAYIFHQQHAVSTPPYHHLDPIVRNCNIFHKKWGIWAMDNWLEMFADKELIDWNKSQTEEIEIRAKPTQKMIEEAVSENAPFA